MANLKTSQLPLAGALSGSELVEGVKDGVNVQTTSQAIANLATKTTVGLSNVDNTSDVNKPVSTAQAAAIATAISNLINGAPSALDTLNELAAALGDDANFAAAVTSALSEKLDSNAGSLAFNNSIYVLNKQDDGQINVGFLHYTPLTEFLYTLTFQADVHYETQTGGTHTFTSSGGRNGVSIVLRMNTPTSVTFPASFIMIPGSDSIDSSKMNIISMIYLENYDGNGNGKVLYSIRNLPAV